VRLFLSIIFKDLDHKSCSSQRKYICSIPL